MGPPPRRQANRMRRRQFIGSGGTATIRLASLPSAGALQRAFLVIMLALALSAAWRPAAAAEKVYRLGILSPGAGVVERMQRTTFPELARLGFAEGKNLAIEVRAGPREQLPEMARQLAESRPDAVIAVGGSAIRAMRQTSPTIPIVGGFIGEDPVAAGFAASLSRPGGTITGIVMLAPELDAKRLELLHETVPNSRNVAALAVNAARDAPNLAAAKQAAERAGVELMVF